jgi:hypothetical protein
VLPSDGLLHVDRPSPGGRKPRGRCGVANGLANRPARTSGGLRVACRRTCWASGIRLPELRIAPRRDAPEPSSTTRHSDPGQVATPVRKWIGNRVSELYRDRWLVIAGAVMVVLLVMLVLLAGEAAPAQVRARRGARHRPSTRATLCLGLRRVTASVPERSAPPTASPKSSQLMAIAARFAAPSEAIRRRL